MRNRIRHVLLLTMIVSAMMAVAAADAAGPTYRKTVDGIVVYLGVIPAELIRGHPKDHPESEMHGGIRTGQHHIMLALFDAKSSARIEDATVKVRVFDGRQYGPYIGLEPMTLRGYMTYGNYISMSGAGPFRIDIQIQREKNRKPVHMSFEWARS